MEVVLFDEHASGHHLKHANRIAIELDEMVQSVSFLGVERTQRHDELFEDIDVSFLAEETQVSDESTETEIVEAAYDFARRSGVDALYFLQIDDITDAILRSERPTEIEVMGELNGAFFRNAHLASPVRALLDLPGLGAAVAETFRRLPHWSIERIPSLAVRTVSLYGCLRVGKLDHVFVHSYEAKAFVERFGFDVPVSEVPDPLDPWFEWNVSRSDARVRLDLPDEEQTVLYFGQLRDDKGIELLLDALQQYEGPPFEMVIAGPPDDVDESEVTALELPEQVGLRTDVEFVPEEEVPYYFLAADAVVVPYRRQFGAQRTSGVFQKSCGALRPIIAPDFGTLGRRVEQQDFGTTFESGSSRALAEALEAVARDDVSADIESMRLYASEQTYTHTTRSIVTAYDNR
jgi:glycosyltransferase involved in cell wall biosynthesis